jgi:hypothetical protein
MTQESIYEALENKNLDIEKVNEIFEQHIGTEEIESMVAMNLSLRTSVYDRSLEQSDTMTNLLVKLSDSSSMEARWAVAKNPHTPLDILEKLSGDKINLVRALVATNPLTPTKILDKFFFDEKIVRDGLSGNGNTSLKILTVLADDSDKMVRLRVAENPKSSKEILQKLLKDKSEDVCLAAQKHMEKR